MKCFRCGAQLTRQDVCLKCGTDVRLYKKIIYSSDRLYNLALEKCNQRDLTAARNYLRQCLQLNKNHYQARNLLGLVYYELGEAASAVREWVISENLCEEDNPATYYLKRIEKSMDSIEGSIKRYNQAVIYLNLKSNDLALIQLKQLMGRSYQILKGRQLLALMYMQEGSYNKAYRLLKSCIRIDRGDSLTRKYIKAIEERRAVGKDSSIRQAVADVMETPQDPDVIIPQNNREYGSYFMYVLYILIGLILGAGLVYYIVVPTVRKQEQQKNVQSLKGYETSMNDLRNDLVDYRAELDRLRDKLSKLSSGEEIADENTVSAYQELLPILTAYINNDVRTIMTEFARLDSTVDDELYQNIYNRLKNDYNDNMGSRSYYAGLAYTDSGESQKALTSFELAYLINGADAKVIYYIGQSHEATGDLSQALYYYQYVCVNYADDPWMINAKAHRDNIINVRPEFSIPDVKPGEELKGIVTTLPVADISPSDNDTN